MDRVSFPLLFPNDSSSDIVMITEGEIDLVGPIRFDLLVASLVFYIKYIMKNWPRRIKINKDLSVS